MVQRSFSGVGVSRCSLLPVSAGSRRIAPGPRGTPTADGLSRPGALPWAIESASLVGTSGSGAGGRSILITSAPVVEWQAVDLGIALFFGGPTPFLLALSKEMGSEKTFPKASAFGFCLLFARAKRRSPQGETLPAGAPGGPHEAARALPLSCRKGGRNRPPLHQFIPRSAPPRRRKLQIPRFAAYGKARSFRYVSSPGQTRFAGLRPGSGCGNSFTPRSAPPQREENLPAANF